MKVLLQIVLICCASGTFAQNPLLPQRDSNAPDGEAFARNISASSFLERESAIAHEILTGNVPCFLRQFSPVTITDAADGRTNVATFFAAPDYLAIGSDDNYLLMPMSTHTAQLIADRVGCVLPTRKMVDEIYRAAEVKLSPTPIPPSPAMTTVPVFARHNAIIRAQRLALTNAHPLGALVAGHKKDVVISARLAGVANKVAIYGWQQTNGIAIQPLYLGHADTWVDYSQCIRLVSQIMRVNGDTTTVAAVLADPKLCGLISDEGVVTNGRYAKNRAGLKPRAPGGVAAGAESPASLVGTVPGAPAFPGLFGAGPGFGELTREIELPDEVRILINAPARESFATNQPVLLVFYALPNGNTIEQTIGKTLRPGDDWHFDLQHIGAQTRWLRDENTNRTLVVAYLEAGMKSWPAWRKKYGDAGIPPMLDGVREIFAAYPVQVALASHSGGGSLMFGYLNAVENIPSWVKRLAWLDSNYGYDSKLHSEKIKKWLATSDESFLCVLAYQDYLARLKGHPFVSERGGTWGRSRVMLADLGRQFSFTSRTNNGLETFSALGGRIQFRLAENPDGRILHTVQVERNGFIQALLGGTAAQDQGYEYLGARAYTDRIQRAN